MDGILQIYQAHSPFHAIPRGHLPMASLGAVWLVPWHHQDARSVYLERGGLSVLI